MHDNLIVFSIGTIIFVERHFGIILAITTRFSTLNYEKSCKMWIVEYY